MSHPRIDPLSETDAKTAAVEAGIPDYVTVLNVNRVLLKHPQMARNFVQYFWDLTYEGTLDPRLRELAIMRVAWRTGSEYEWTQHWHLATSLGLPEADLIAVRDPAPPSHFSPADRAALAVADDLVAAGTVSEATWGAVQEALPTEPERIELVLAAAGWRMVASILESLAVPLEAGVAGWPPDGRRPA